jgi:hypothetical protein
VASDHEVVDLGEKAKMLVKLGSRNKIFILYNLTSVEFTRRILVNLNRMMAHADLVERRVIFGVDRKYQPLVSKMIQMMRLDRNTKFTQSYTDAVNTITDDEGWKQERRHENLVVAQDKRQPIRVYTEEEFLDLEMGEGRLIHLPDFDGKHD